MTATMTQTPQTEIKLSQADINRMSVPTITCRACGVTTTRSNPTEDMCDKCHDNSPMHVFRASHGVSWHTNSAGVPN